MSTIKTWEERYEQSEKDGAYCLSYACMLAEITELRAARDKDCYDMFPVWGPKSFAEKWGLNPPQHKSEPAQGEPCTGDFPVYTAQAMRDLLEQAARIAFNATCPDGDDYAHGYNKAAAEINRAIRAMIKETQDE